MGNADSRYRRHCAVGHRRGANLTSEGVSITIRRGELQFSIRPSLVTIRGQARWSVDMIYATHHGRGTLRLVPEARGTQRCRFLLFFPTFLSSNASYRIGVRFAQNKMFVPKPLATLKKAAQTDTAVCPTFPRDSAATSALGNKVEAGVGHGLGYSDRGSSPQGSIPALPSISSTLLGWSKQRPRTRVWPRDARFLAMCRLHSAGCGRGCPGLNLQYTKSCESEPGG